jgi:hypothetical protein
MENSLTHCIPVVTTSYAVIPWETLKNYKGHLGQYI